MKINYISILGMLLLASCSNNLEQITEEKDFSAAKALKINVTAGDFAVDGEAQSRITDNGAVSTFEKNDRVGLIVLEDGQPIEKNNIPFIYDGTEWIFDLETAQKEGKSVYYYNSDKTNMTYIMYYPYSSDANSITNVDGLKAAFTPQEDQSTEEKYRASDLLVWSFESPKALEGITAKMEHAFSSFSLNVVIGGTLDDGENTPYTAGEVSNVKFTIGDEIIAPYKAEDGTYRYILSKDFTGDIRWTYITNGKNYSNTRELETVQPNTRYVQNEKFTAEGNYSFENAHVGDFYCVTSDGGKGYLVPYNAKIDVLKDRTCLGIVFRVKEDTEEDDPYYGTFNDYHGTVVALNDAPGKMTWTYGESESLESWLTSWTDTKPADYESIRVKDKPQGYVNTLAMRQYHESASDKKKIKIIDNLDTFSTQYTLPEGTTGWYCPSLFELLTIVRGQGSENVNTENVGKHPGLDFLNVQYQSLYPGKKLFETNDHWSSTESNNTPDGNYVFNVPVTDNNGWFNGKGDGDKNKMEYYLRPVFSF